MKTITKPAVNPDPDDIADRAKYRYAAGTKLLADVQHRLAELAGTGKLDPDESMSLQFKLVELWEHLYAGTTCAVRDGDTDDRTWDWADNTYSEQPPRCQCSRSARRACRSRARPRPRAPASNHSK
jgi:hypothetical protein